MSRSPSRSGTAARRAAWALLVLRLGLGLFLLVWGLEKFVLPARTVGIYAKYYSFPIDAAVTPLLGFVECAVALAILAGLWRRWSYGLAILIHGYSTVSTWRQIIDPWGLIFGEVKHLFLAAVPVLAAFVALYLLREHDSWTVDGWRARRGAERGPAPPG